MAPPKNHYTTIGVPENATADEIKKAYRKLAKKYHPDANAGDKAKEAKFKEVTEAHEVLGDPKQRKAYDEQLHSPFASGRGGGGYRGAPPDMSGIDLDELFSQFGGAQGRRGRTRVDPGGQGGFGDIFGGMFGGQGRPGGEAPASARGEDVRARLDIELPEAALGAEKTISIDGQRSLKVKIPAGITPGKTIRLSGQGQPSHRGGPAGDLLVEVHEKPHPRFHRSPDAPQDIEVAVPVALDVAILGGKAEVPTLEGTTLSLTIPAMSSSGKRLRLRGKGAIVTPGNAGKSVDSSGKPGENGRGDLYATVSIQLPDPLSPDAKLALEAFAKLARPS